MSSNFDSSRPHPGAIAARLGAAIGIAAEGVALYVSRRDLKYPLPPGEGDAARCLRFFRKHRDAWVRVLL